jgi:RND family efflux transporter MFP subunit
MNPPKALFVAAAAAAFSGCGREAGANAPASVLSPAAVRLSTVRAQTVPVLTEATGVVRPVRRAQLAARVMGQIEEMPAALGQRVRSGDILVRVGAGEMAARLAQAQSQLNAARRDFERERDLLAKGASTADMVKGLEDRLEASQAVVREAEAMLGYTIVRAPFDGVISRKFADAGDLASPGEPLVEIEGAGAIEVEADVPDSLAASLAPGEPLAVEVPSAAAAFTGSLTEMSPAADPNAHTVTVKIAVPPGAHVRSGEFARVQVPGPPVTVLLAPASCVSTLGQMERVFVAGEDHRAVLRLVTTGASRGDLVEILSGLDEGDLVVRVPPVGLREGQPLEVRP